MMVRRTKKSHYRSPTPEDSLRHKLADGVPVHELLYYLHGRDSLDQDVRELVNAGVLIRTIETKMAELVDNGSIPDVDRWEESQQVFDEFRCTLRDLTSGIRRALVARMVQGVGDG